jgi:hypothetical protein
VSTLEDRLERALRVADPGAPRPARGAARAKTPAKFMSTPENQAMLQLRQSLSFQADAMGRYRCAATTDPRGDLVEAANAAFASPRLYTAFVAVRKGKVYAFTTTAKALDMVWWLLTSGPLAPRLSTRPKRELATDGATPRYSLVCDITG